MALPKGRLQGSTAQFLERAGLRLTEYDEASRSYRPRSLSFPNLLVKVFQEKDIPVQVTIGNYHLGICGLDWIEELLVKYPREGIVKVRDLGYGRGALYAVASQDSSFSLPGSVGEEICMVSEYPNLAESLALGWRLPRFKVFGVWGASEAYLPDDAQIAVLWEPSSHHLYAQGLRPVKSLFSTSAFLIAHRQSLQTVDMSSLLSVLKDGAPVLEAEASPYEAILTLPPSLRSVGEAEPMLRLALPDGHQQRPVAKLLSDAGISIKGYGLQSVSRHPIIGVGGVQVKVIRPQDMPLQVANGNFDMAITGEDWLRDHWCRFPSSPVEELLPLGVGQVRVAAVVSHRLSVRGVEDLRGLLRKRTLPVLRVASEYVNIADRYVRERHLSPYRVIPTWGASEAFLPEDADLLIENTQTGTTLARHNLRIIDEIFSSQACLIVNRQVWESPQKSERVKELAGRLEKVGEGQRGEEGD